MLGNSGGDPAATESGGSSGGDAGPLPESGGGGNRWPRQETVALIKIRTDMDVAFRDSSLKGPLWDEVSRKLAELGFHRSAKKCKEKFENVFKYHKRTKEGRSTKSEGKTYRFFDQLEALDTQPPQPPQPRPPSHQSPTAATPLSMAMPVNNPSTIPSPFNTTNINNNTIPSTQNLPQFHNPISIPSTNPFPSNTLPPQTNPFNISFSPPVPQYKTNPTPVSSYASTSSDEEPERKGKRKRKWVDFFERLTKEVMQKQEEMQKKFLEALERRERERVTREDAWRAQEMARMNREREILAQERAVAAAKDTAVFAFLQKVSASDQQIITPSETLRQNNIAPPPPQPPSEPVRQTPPPQPPTMVQRTPLPPQPQQQTPQQQPPVSVSMPTPALALTPTPPQLNLQIQPLAQNTRNDANTDNGGEIVNFKFPNPSSSRWPKAEIEALIKLRTNLDLKYQENVPKGPLWEDISAAMLRLGYNRNAKRCKEKWENINKYYKKVKESNKKRPEDSKTCPYFSQLEAIYKERFKSETQFKQENNVAAPIMAQPEQQWPVHQSRPELPLMEGQDSEDEMDDEDDDEEDEAGNYELVASKPVGAVE